MNLNLNPEQFLAVYTSVALNQSLTAQEVKSKMDVILLDALGSIDDSKNQTKFSHWAKRENEKISGLKNELKSIKIPPIDPFDNQPIDTGT